MAMHRGMEVPTDPAWPGQNVNTEIAIKISTWLS
jgi:hypothetical protein